MTIRIKAGEVAVDTAYYWLPMETCPKGVKVQLLNPGNVAVYGTYTGSAGYWKGWAPLPKIRRPARDETQV